MTEEQEEERLRILRGCMCGHPASHMTMDNGEVHCTYCNQYCFSMVDDFLVQNEVKSKSSMDQERHVESMDRVRRIIKSDKSDTDLKFKLIEEFSEVMLRCVHDSKRDYQYVLPEILKEVCETMTDNLKRILHG